LNWEQTYEAGNRAFAGGLYAVALTHYLQALDYATKSGDQQAIAHTQRGLAKTYLESGKVEEAKNAAGQANEIDRAFWGYDNQEVAEDKFLLAECLRRQGTFDGSRELFEQVLALRSSLFGETHDDSLAAIIRLIWLDAQEDCSESLIDRMRLAAEIFSRLHPTGTLAKALNLKALLQPYMDENRQPEAESILQRILQSMRTVFGGGHPEVRYALTECAAVMKISDKNLSAWRLQAQANLLERQESTRGQAQAEEASLKNVDSPVVDSESAPGSSAHLELQMTEESVRQSSNQTAVDYAQIAAAQVLVEDPVDQSIEQGNRALADNVYDSPANEPSTPAEIAGSQSHASSDQESSITNLDLEPPTSESSDESIESPPIASTSMIDRYLGEALMLANLSIEPEQVRRLWIRAAAGFGIVSAIIYLFSGYWYLMCDAFVAGSLICTAGICISLAAAAIWHQKKLDAQVPAALEIMVSSLKAGAPILEIIKVLSETLPLPIRAEFERTISLLKEGRSLQQALKQLIFRVRSHELVLLTDAIQVSHDTRGNLADQVAIIAASCRERQSTRSSVSLSSPRMQILMIVAGGMLLMIALGVMFEPAFGATVLTDIGVRLFIYMAFVVIGMVVFLSASPPKADDRVRKIAAEGEANEQTTVETKTDGLIASNIGKVSAYLHKVQMQDRIRGELSNFVEMVVKYLESGVSLPQAVNQVRNKANASCPTLCRELEGSLANPTSFKSSLPDAFKAIGEKYGVTELATLAATIAAAEKTKSSVAMQLSEQAKFLRNHLQRKRQERAAAGFTIAMVIGVTFAVIMHLVSTMFSGH